MYVVKINLGCGPVTPAGWVNIDRSPGLVLDKIPGLRGALGRLGVIPKAQATAKWSGDVMHRDVRKGLPFATGTVDAIYSSHMLEHVPRDTANKILVECRRVLRDGGVIRVAIPDIRVLVDRYVADGGEDAAETFIRETGMGVEQGPTGSRRLVQLVSGARHKWMYDEASLQRLFVQAGFADPVMRTYLEGDCPTIDEVETREESLFLEATKHR